jgi:HSP20 family protein
MADLPVEKQEKAPASRAEAPRHPLLALREEMDRLFDDFFTGWPLGPLARRPEADPWRRLQGALGMAYPAVDAKEDETAYRVTAELPGMTEKDVEVTLANGVLMLKGHKREEKEERKEDYYVSERRFGSFQRSLRLPEGVDQGRIEAELKDGVLTVVLPKTAEAQAEAKRIEVKAA